MLLLLTAFLGCASEPDPGATPPGQPPAGMAPATPGPGDQGTAGSAGGGQGQGQTPPATPDIPAGIAKLATDGKTVEIPVQLKGAPSANLDFLVAGEDGRPQPIAQERLTGPSVTLTAPKGYAKGPVWACAWFDEAGDGPDPKDKNTCAPAALKFDGTDKLVFDMEHPLPPPADSPMATAPKPEPPPGTPGGAAPGAGGGGGGAPGGAPVPATPPG